MAYLPAGQEETPERDDLLVIAQQRLAIDKAQLRLAKRAALFDGIKMVFTIAIPVAAFLGIQRYFRVKKKEES